jgi:hypothetical protein
MVARQRGDVAALNARARARLQELGRVSGAELELAGGAFAAGDRIVVNGLQRVRPGMKVIPTLAPMVPDSAALVAQGR